MVRYPGHSRSLLPLPQKYVHQKRCWFVLRWLSQISVYLCRSFPEISGDVEESRVLDDRNDLEKYSACLVIIKTFPSHRRRPFSYFFISSGFSTDEFLFMLYVYFVEVVERCWKSPSVSHSTCRPQFIRVGYPWGRGESGSVWREGESSLFTFNLCRSGPRTAGYTCEFDTCGGDSYSNDSSLEMRGQSFRGGPLRFFCGK